MSLDFTIPELHIGNAGTPPLQFFKRGFNLGSSGSTPSWQDIILSGNTALTLVNAKANGLNYLKLFGNTEQRNLPEGYTQLSYIESTGTQYIDTGITSIKNTNVLKLKIRPLHVANTRFITFQNPSAGADNIGLFIAGGYLYYQYGSVSRLSTPVEVGSDYVIEAGNGYLIVNGTSYTGTPVEEFTLANPLYIGMAINAGAVDNRRFNGDIYYFHYEDKDGNILFSGISAERNSDNVLGMYDTVSGTFFTNAGTGNFVAGDVAVPTPDIPFDIVSNNGVLKFGVLSTNLLDLANCTDGYYYTPAGEYAATPNARLSNYIPVKAGVTYTVGLTGTEGQSNVRINLFDTAKNWLSQTLFVSYAGEKRAQSITPTQDGFLAFSANYLSSSRVDWNTAQVVQGSYTAETMPEYEPYRTGIYADGTVETVEVHGKNLYNPATMFSSKAMAISGSVIYWCYSSGGKAIKVPCKPNTTYTLTYTGGNRCFIGGFTNDVPLESDSAIACDFVIFSGSGSSASPKTFTTPANCYYVCCGLANSAGGEVTDIQLELGSTATEYEPYFNGGSAMAEMLLKVGNYQDVQSVLDGEVTRNVGIKVLDGTEGWSSLSGYSSVFYFTAEDVDGAVTKDIPCLCTHYEGIAPKTSVSNMQDNSVKCGYTNSSNKGNVYIKDNRFVIETDFEQFLADQYANGTPVIVVYPLATATIETVTGQPLTIQAGTNIVEITQASINNLPLEVSYKGTV